jgi:hypothetical protein
MNDDDLLTVTMKAVLWNRALALLGDQPSKVSAEVFIEVLKQCTTQQRQDQQGPDHASC